LSQNTKGEPWNALKNAAARTNRQVPKTTAYAPPSPLGIMKISMQKLIFNS